VAGERPGIDQVNYVSRVRIPTLMLSGKYDSFFPYETSAKPMFDLLGTPKDQKVQKLYDTDHYIPGSSPYRVGKKRRIIS
jgi:pimeloyl-ACP methyl ester carboxylesterase